MGLNAGFDEYIIRKISNQIEFVFGAHLTWWNGGEFLKIEDLYKKVFTSEVLFGRTARRRLLMAKTNDGILELCSSVLIGIALIQIRHVAGSGLCLSSSRVRSTGAARVASAAASVRVILPHDHRRPAAGNGGILAPTNSANACDASTGGGRRFAWAYS